MRPKVVLSIDGDVVGEGKTFEDAIKDFETEYDASDFNKASIDVYSYSHSVKVKEKAFTYERVK